MTMQITQRITPFLSYKHEAEAAAKFYVSVLPDSKIIRKVKHPTDGSVLTVEFELCGMKFVGLNAGQDWKFTETFSLCIACEDQAEIDRLWQGLLAGGGSELACGWLKDKFGMCWQIMPKQLESWLASDQPENQKRMFEAMWQMQKPDVAKLQQAFEGRG